MERMEHDSMGQVLVDSTKYWGAQTQRSYNNFAIGGQLMPKEIIYAIANIKGACASANCQLGKLSQAKAQLIGEVSKLITEGTLDEHFPLVVWQTGSGTQSNMNVNEVIANYANIVLGGSLHPNDDVNMSQSSNDVFPTAINVATKLAITNKLLPNLQLLIDELLLLQSKHNDTMKIGRTHLQDATPITFGEEVSGWVSTLITDYNYIEMTVEQLSTLAIGGTAVGNGINAPSRFDEVVCNNLSDMTGSNFLPMTNKFSGLSSKNQIVLVHAAVKALACDLLKIANDIRLLASGPRCGLGEINLPANEPGSSIMPGKVNPTQAEAVTMVAVQIMGNDTTISVSASQGNFQLNVYMPVISYNILQSINLLSDVLVSFNNNCVKGITVNKDKMQDNLHKSLMMVTYFSPIIGYDKSAEVAKKAYNEKTTIKQACLALGYMTEEAIDEVLSKVIGD